MAVCEKCGELFSSSLDLLRHIKSSCEQEPIQQCYECYECSETFTRRDNLERHIKCLHMVKKTSFKCLHCSEEFSLKQDREKHISHIHMIEQNPQSTDKVCKRCLKRFSSVNTMKRHFNTVHRKKTQVTHFECNECKGKFSRKDGLIRHIQCLHMPQRRLFKCSQCSREFNFKSNCAKHVRRVHMTEKKHLDGKEKICKRCGKQFTSVYNMKRHCKSVHGTKAHLTGNVLPVVEALFECNECSARFTRRDGLLRHIECRHLFGKKSFVCVYCSRRYSSRYSLKQHIRSCLSQNVTNCNKKIPDESRSKELKCLICHQGFDTTGLMNDHYERDHSIVYVYENLEFATRTEFENWMNNERKTYIQCYLRNHWETETHLAKVYRCHRSGEKRKKTAPKRKRADSKKLNGFCPMHITLKESKIDGKCSVNYQKTHVGHSCEENELLYIRLKEEEKLDMASEISRGVIENVMLTEDESSEQGNYSRLSMSAYDNEVSIMSQFSPDKCFTSVFKDDSLNIRHFVIKNKDSILFYKVQGEYDERFPTLANDDFALGFMDDGQERALMRYGHKIVAFNGTYGTNPNDFILHSMSVQDVDYEGYPVAFLLSNRNDKAVINILLQHIKQRMGILKPKAVISDMQHFYFNAWIEEMGPVLDRLYCIWDVHESWKRNYLKINNKELRQVVKRGVENLSRELDKELFEQKLNDLMTNYNVDLLNFLKYFCRFVNTKEYWAFCYRKHVGYNTNMGFEKFHRTFKEKNTSGIKIKSVYECLCLLRTYLKWKENDIANKSKRGKSCHETRALRKRHKIAEKQFTSKEISIKQITGTCWQVQSFQDTEDDVLAQELYTVQKLKIKECTQYSDIFCSLPCTKCKICHHDFVCNCPDNSVQNYMCEHIHALGIYLLNQESNDDRLAHEDDFKKEETTPLKRDFNPEELIYIDEDFNEEVVLHVDEDFNQVEVLQLDVGEDIKQEEEEVIHVDEDFTHEDFVNVDEDFEREEMVFADEEFNLANLTDKDSVKLPGCKYTRSSTRDMVYEVYIT